jgi:aerobic C4-dicarboxylate transport protein
VDPEQMRDVLDRKAPFDEQTMVDDHDSPPVEEDGAKVLVPA